MVYGNFKSDPCQLSTFKVFGYLFKRQYKLYRCIKRNNQKKAEYLIDRERKQRSMTNEELMHVLMRTYKYVNRRTIRYQLMEKLILPNLEDFELNEYHPLWVVVGFGDKELLELLHNRQVRISSESQLEWHIFFSKLLYHAMREFINYVLGYCQDNYDRLWFHSNEVVEFLVRNSPDVNILDETGCNALHFICKFYCSSYRVCNWLLIKGINIDERNNAGETPLYVAVCNERWEMVEFLLDHGADGSILKNDSKLNNTIKSQIIRSELLTRILITRGFVKSDEKNLQGYNFLHEAVESGYTETVVNLLLNFGAKIDARGYANQTPLSWSIYRSKNCITNRLVKEIARIKFGEEVQGERTIYDLAGDLRLINNLFLDFKELYDKAYKELYKTSEMIIYKNFSVYTILAKNCYQLTEDFKIPEVQRWLSVNNDFYELFPLYRNCIYSKLENTRTVEKWMARIKVEVTNEVSTKVHSAFKNTLPDVIIRKIIEFACFPEIYSLHL